MFHWFMLLATSDWLYGSLLTYYETLMTLINYRITAN